jgi:hypothetical protein
MRHLAVLTASLSLFAGACDDETTDTTCGGMVDLVVVSPAADAVVSTDLVITGTATQTEGRAIRRILVGGFSAENTGFNFDAWTATVPLSVLLSAKDPGAGTATLEIEAFDSCTSPESSGSLALVVLLDDEAGVEIDDLQLEVDYPGAESYLPANGENPAKVTISAGPQAHGATIRLEADDGLELDGVDSVKLVSDADGADAEAVVLVTASSPGNFLLVAEGKDANDVQSLRAAGAPLMFPPALELAPGQTAGITVDTEGRVSSCQATPATGVTVTSGGIDISITPNAVDVDGDERVDLRVTVDAALVDPAAVTITCLDPFGQAASAQVSATP